jgi:hypothetical protein
MSKRSPRAYRQQNSRYGMDTIKGFIELRKHKKAYEPRFTPKQNMPQWLIKMQGHIPIAPPRFFQGGAFLMRWLKNHCIEIRSSYLKAKS